MWNIIEAFDLTGKNALITGGLCGLGLEIAVSLVLARAVNDPKLSHGRNTLLWGQSPEDKHPCVDRKHMN